MAAEDDAICDAKAQGDQKQREIVEANMRKKRAVFNSIGQALTIDDDAATQRRVAEEEA
jgi:hypothetical protein